MVRLDGFGCVSGGRCVLGGRLNNGGRFVSGERCFIGGARLGLGGYISFSAGYARRGNRYCYAHKGSEDKYKTHGEVT